MASTVQIIIQGDDRATRIVRELQRTIDTAAKEGERSFAKLGRSIQSAGQGIQSVGGGLTKLTAPLAGVAAASAKLASDFGGEMRKVNTLVGVSREQVDKWAIDILKLAPQLGKSPKELAEGLFFVTSAGIRGAEAMDVLVASAKASAAGLGETKDVANAVTSAMQAYGIANLSAEQATNVLIATVREGKLEANELSGTIGRVIPLAAQLGISFGQVGGFIATFTRLGVDAAEATTALRGIMATLIRPTQQAKEALASMGLTFEDLRQSIKEKGLAATLIELVQATGDNEDAIAAIIPNVRALTGVLGVAGEQAEAFRQIEQSVVNDTDALSKAFEGTVDTSGFIIKQFKALGSTVLISLGQTLLPVIKQFVEGPLTSLIEKVQVAIDRFKELSPETQRVVIAITAVALAIGPVLFAVGALVASVGAIIAGIGALSPAVIGVAGALGVGAGAFGLAALKSEAFRELLSDLAPLAKALANVLRTSFAVIVQVIDAALTTVINVMGFFVNAFTGDSEAAAKNVENIFAAMGDLVIGIIEAMWDGIVRQFTGRADEALAKVGELKDRVVGFFTDMKDRVVGNSIVPEMVDGVVQEFQRQHNTVVPLMQQTEIQVVDSYKNMQLLTAAESQKMVAEIDSASTQMRDALVGRLQEAVPGVEDAFSRMNTAIFGTGQVTQQTAERWDQAKKLLGAFGIEVKATAAAQEEGNAKTEEASGGLARHGTALGGAAKKATEHQSALQRMIVELEKETVKLAEGEGALRRHEIATAFAAEKDKVHAAALRDKALALLEEVEGLEAGKLANEQFAEAVQKAVDSNNRHSDVLKRHHVDLEQAELKARGYEDAARILELRLEGLTASEANAILEREKAIAKMEEEKQKAGELAQEFEDKFGRVFTDLLPQWAKNWLGFLDNLSGGFGGFLGKFGGLLDSFDNLIGGGLGKVVNSVGGFVKGFGSKLLGGLGLGEGVFGAVSKFMGGPWGAAVIAGLDLLGIDVGAAVNKIAGFATDALGAIGKGVGAAIGNIGGAIKGLFGGGKSEAEKIAGAVGDATAFGSAIDLFQKQFGRLPTTLEELGSINVPVTDRVRSSSAELERARAAGLIGSGGAFSTQQLYGTGQARPLTVQVVMDGRLMGESTTLVDAVASKIVFQTGIPA